MSFLFEADGCIPCLWLEAPFIHMSEIVGRELVRAKVHAYAISLPPTMLMLD